MMWLIHKSSDPKHILDRNEYFIQYHNSVANLLVLRKQISNKKNIMLKIWLSSNQSEG